MTFSNKLSWKLQIRIVYQRKNIKFRCSFRLEEGSGQDEGKRRASVVKTK